METWKRFSGHCAAVGRGDRNPKQKVLLEFLEQKCPILIFPIKNVKI